MSAPVRIGTMLDVLTMTARFPRRSGRGEFVGTGDALMAPMSGRIRDAEEAPRRTPIRSFRGRRRALRCRRTRARLPRRDPGVALSRWIAESGPRPLTPRQVLRKPDIPVAAAVMAPPENPRTAADVPALNRRWNLALDTGLLRADGGTVTAGRALATWPPGDPDVLAAWLDGLLTVSGSETGSPWDDTLATDMTIRPRRTSSCSSPPSRKQPMACRSGTSSSSKRQSSPSGSAWTRRSSGRKRDHADP